MTCHDCGAGRLEGALSCAQCLTIYADASIEGHSIESLIGCGGMGQIYLATHPVLERRVAVKVLQLNASGAKAKQELKDRFLREARAMARINHRAIVQVYSAGISGEVPYIIMEYLSGRNLAQVLQKTPIMAVGRTLDFLIQLTEALAYAWEEKQIIHRDVKPDNVMLLDDDKQIKLLDLGIAKTREDMAGASLTQSGIGLGTPTYMAPEQMTDARSVDFRADAYAMGIMALQMLSGRKPFQVGNEARLYVEKLRGVPEDAFRMPPGAPASLRTLLRRVTASDPEDRPGSYDEILDGLREARELFQSGEEIKGVDTVVMRLPATTRMEAPRPASSAAELPPPDERTGWSPGPNDYMPLIDQMHGLLQRICSRGRIGDYEMGNLIGYGGMGAVFRAEYVPTGRLAALKFLLNGGDEVDVQKRVRSFQREAELVQRLRHPSIVDIRGIGQWEDLHFIDMELFLGLHDRPINLSDYAIEFGDRQGRLESEEMRSIALVLLDALAYAHSQGVVHCDLKPENILFQYVGDAGAGYWHAHLKLTDFGVAKVIGEKFVLESVTKSVTAFGAGGSNAPDDAKALIGTYDYMSPEQRRGKPANEVSDLFAVGMMLLRLLTGRKQLGIRGKPSDLRGGLDPGWDEVILTTLRERPASRYPSAAAMADAIDSLVRG
jgi:serine/threonine protein kinase